MLNSLHCIGRLGQDPELKHTPDGKSVCNFSLAIPNGYKDDDTLWLRVTVWNKPAEAANKYLKKGKLAFVGGCLKIDKYTDKDGVEKTSVNLIANRVLFLSPKNESQTEMNVNNKPDQDEDIPF